MNSVLAKRVSELDEHNLVQLILSVLKKYQTTDLIVQPGDDAAVLAKLNKPTVTADVLIEDVHFKTNWSSASDIGTRAAAANLADLVAMGAKPVALTVSLGLPPNTKVGFVLDLVEAISIEASLVFAQVVGGDVTRSEKLVVSITAIGDCETRSPILRSGAKVGDQIGIIGRIGWAQAGLDLLNNEKTEPALLIAAHQRPQVFYSAVISAFDCATSMVDISDGLLVDLGHIAKASEVSIAIDSKMLGQFVSSELNQAAQLLNVDPINWILSGGDDHAIAISAPSLPDGVIRIGEVQSGSGVWLDEKPAQLLGYRHFSD